MRIGVDGYYFERGGRGMANFARSLIDPLADEAKVILPSTNSILQRIAGQQKYFPLWEQCLLPSLAHLKHVDYLLCPYNTSPICMLSDKKLILVVHDLIFLENYSARSISCIQNFGRNYRRAIVPFGIKNAYRIITVSEYSRNTIAESFGVSPSSITVIPNSISDEWLEDCAYERGHDPYIFSVSGEAPSKNCNKLLEAFAMLKPARQNLKLHIAGIKVKYHAEFQEQAGKLGILKMVTFFGQLSDAEIKREYRRANAFVCASLSEGFGIPLLEAMSSGTPCASSNFTALPEVAGDCVEYFNPTDVREISNALQVVLAGGARIQKHVEDGKRRARLFARSLISQKILEFWNEIQ